MAEINYQQEGVLKALLNSFFQKSVTNASEQHY